MLHTSYYTYFAPHSEELLSHQIDKSHNTFYSPTKPVEDCRFNKNVGYSGIGNCLLMRINACAVLRLHFWCLKPSDSWGKTCVQYAANLVVKPFAALHDAILNTALTVEKCAMVVLIVGYKFVEKAIIPSRDVQFGKATEYAFYNLWCQVDATTTSYAYLICQVTTLGAINLLGPKYDPYFRLGDSFNWSYLVNKNELILDRGRIDFLKQQCGWADVPAERFKDMCKPWSQPQAMLIEYKDIGGMRHFTYTWRITQYQ